jgi:rubrerythrin
MLSGKGFEKVYNVSGGIKAWQAKTALGSQDLGMALFSGRESAQEVLKVAYSLEQGLQDFYISMAEKAEDSQVKSLFSKLSEIEVKHQRSLLSAYNELDQGAVSPVTRQAFEVMVGAKAMEGGLTTDQYLELFSPDLGSQIEVISLAMSIEAQALDLYQRLGARLTQAKARKIIHAIANEEKTHLASLGKLMDEL